MVSEVILDNVLVNQKNGILSLVNVGEYDKAIFLLESFLELWETCSYTYKIREVIKRIDSHLFAEYDTPSLHWKIREKLEKMRQSLRNKFPSYI